MKKNKFEFIFLIIIFFILCIYLYKARQLNTFPFNSKIGYFFQTHLNLSFIKY